MDILRNVARYFEGAGDFVRWEAFNLRILNICKTGLGQDYWTVAEVLGDMGAHYFTLGNADKAEACLRQALAICENDADLKISKLPEFLLTYAGVAFIRGQVVIARTILDEIMEMLEQAPCMNTALLLSVLTNYAAVFRETRDFTEFDRVSRRAEETAKEVWKTKPASIVAPILSLIRSHETLGRFDDAERISGWFWALISLNLADEDEAALGAVIRDQLMSNCRDNDLPESFEKLRLRMKPHFMG